MTYDQSVGKKPITGWARLASAVDTLTMNTSDRNTHHRTSPATLISRRFSHKPTVCTRNPLAMTPKSVGRHSGMLAQPRL